jgi:hypothetical protein
VIEGSAQISQLQIARYAFQEYEQFKTETAMAASMADTF